MAKSFRVKILDRCQVSPPPNTAPRTSLPLTFFDFPWLFFPPSQPLFFFEYPHPTSHFLSTTLPALNHSLSLTLQHFFPFAGKLTFSLDSSAGKPKIDYIEGNYVLLTVAECSGDFHHVSGHHQRSVKNFYSLVPELESDFSEDKQEIPLLAIQITVFPNFGICLGLAFQNVIADGRTFNIFMKTWSSFCKESSNFLVNSPMSYDRTVIIDSYGLEDIFLNEWRNRISSEQMVIGTKANGLDLSDMVRATFVVGSTDMQRIKQWIMARCKEKNQSQPIHLSPYVLACSFVWVCLVKSQIQDGVSEKCPGEDPNYFGFVAGGISRLDYPVPTSYLGNCVGFGRSMAINKDLLSEDGIIVAANALGNTIKKQDKEFFGEAKKWISDWEVLFGSEVHVIVSGSPKLDLYERDFGWGRPKKIEDISIDKMRAISLTESREMQGGIDVGLALPKARMDAFAALFKEGLNILK